MRRFIIILLAVLLLPWVALAANYSLEIIQPQPSLTTANRYYKAYPGIEYKVPIGIFGGAYPFTYSLTSYPEGMTINAASGIITWSNPTTSGSPHSVTVSVTDAENTTATRSWTITVATTGFIFVSATGTHSEYNGCTPPNCGTGTIDNPFLDLGDVYAGVIEVTGEDFSSANCDPGTPCGDTTYDEYTIYFRAGTYAPKGLVGNLGATDLKIDWRTHKPMIWLGYPGETATIDHTASGASASGAMFKAVDGATKGNYFFQGLTFTNPINNSLYFGGADVNWVVFDNTFQDSSGMADGYNPGYVMLGTAGQYPVSQGFGLVCHNTFKDAGGTSTSYLKFYSTYKASVNDNILSDNSGTDTEGIALKAYVKYIDVRHNYISNIEQNAIGGNFNYSENNEIRYNRVTDASGSSYPGALVLNYQTENCGVAYAYRNTFEGYVTVRGAGTGDGPYYLDDNVIINESGEVDGIDCGSVACSDESIIVLGAGADANLVGDAADAIIDASGNLQGAYLQYLGSKGYQITAAHRAGGAPSGGSWSGQ